MKDVESKVLPVLEMSCAVCANNVEGTVKALPGVEEASVNFAANTLSVTYHPSVISLQKMQEAVQAAMDKMVSGEWDVFQQDVYDVDGNLVPAATFTDDYLYSGMTDLLVKGVVAK